MTKSVAHQLSSIIPFPVISQIGKKNPDISVNSFTFFYSSRLDFDRDAHTPDCASLHSQS